MSAYKYTGSDHWSPVEMTGLPNSLLNGLVSILKLAEAAGRWPELLIHTIMALFSKEGATHEGQLIPISVLRYTSRACMLIRRAYDTACIGGMHEGDNPSAMQLTWRTTVH